MVSTYKYKSLHDTIVKLLLQVKDSKAYAQKNCPYFENPRELFYWLRDRITYIDDPPDHELLMTMQTFFDNNPHLVPGGGDCDDFVITTLACMVRNKWKNIYIYLTGHEKIAPVHIYVGIDWQGRREIFDLTEENYNSERPYKFRQIVPLH